MPTEAHIATKSKRRWLRYGLRTLFVFVSMACCLFAWLGAKVRDARRQAAAVKAMQDIGVGLWYSYDYEVEFQKRQRIPSVAEALPPGPEWIRDWLGIDYVAHVTEVTIGSQPPGTALSILRDLPYLQSVVVDKESVTDADLADLAGLSQLEDLMLRETQIDGSGLVHLQGLDKLRTLSLAGSPVNSAALALLCKLPNLESLDLSSTQVDDSAFEHLLRMPKLRKVLLGHSQVSFQGFERLEDARPELEVYH